MDPAAKANEETLDLDEDLFDFDELLRDVEQFADECSPAQPLDQAGEQAPAPPAPLPAAAQAGARPLQGVSDGVATHRPHRRPPPVAPRTPPAAPPEAAAPSVLAAAVETIPEELTPADATSPRRFVLSRGLMLALGAVAAIQLIVLVLVVHALGTVQGVVRDVGGQVESSSRSVREQAEDIARTFDQAARPVVAPRAEGEAALERAGELLARGEHQRARETLYALLAVADRLPPGTRHDVEARARFLVADTWRLEADAADALADAAGRPEFDPIAEEPQ